MHEYLEFSTRTFVALGEPFYIDLGQTQVCLMWSLEHSEDGNVVWCLKSKRTSRSGS